MNDHTVRIEGILQSGYMEQVYPKSLKPDSRVMNSYTADTRTYLGTMETQGEMTLLRRN